MPSINNAAKKEQSFVKQGIQAPEGPESQINSVAKTQHLQDPPHPLSLRQSHSIHFQTSMNCISLLLSHLRFWSLAVYFTLSML
jgi:hypothetical protein